MIIVMIYLRFHYPALFKCYIQSTYFYCNKTKTTCKTIQKILDNVKIIEQLKLKQAIFKKINK